MIKTIITPTNTNVNLSIPEDYVGKRIEVTFLSLEEQEHKSSKKTMADFWGVISEETAENLYEQVKKSRDEWDKNL